MPNDKQAGVPESVERAVADVARLTQTHDDAVMRFYVMRHSAYIFAENRIIGLMVQAVAEQYDAVARLQSEKEALVKALREAQAKLDEIEAPILPEGATVVVNHPRYHGPGIVSFDSAIHKRYVAVTLGNGNTWHYERETVALADAEGRETTVPESSAPSPHATASPSGSGSHPHSASRQ